MQLGLIAERGKRTWLKTAAARQNVNSPSFSFDITETYSGIGKARLAACSHDYTISETWLIERAYLDLPPASYTALKFWHHNRKQFWRLYKVSRQILCALASLAPVERLFSIFGYILSQWRLRTNDRKFENVLFSNVNYDYLTWSYESGSNLTVIAITSDGVKICQNTVPLRWWKAVILEKAGLF